MLPSDKISALEKIGFKRWQKHGRDRLYLNYDDIQEFYGYGSKVGIPAVYIDVYSGEAVIYGTHYKNRVLEALKKYIEHYMPDNATGVKIDANNIKTSKLKICREAMEARNFAKALGGKALVGSIKQKNIGEVLRAKRLNALPEEEAIRLVTESDYLNNANFWIENADSPKFTMDDIVNTVKKLGDLREKYYDILARTCESSKKEAARNDIINTIKSSPVFIKTVTFPNFDVWEIIKNEKSISKRLSK